MTFRTPMPALCCSFLLCSCSSSFSPSDLARWLGPCDTNDECEEAGLACICGVCTKVCDDDDDCRDVAAGADDAACVPVDESGSARQCQPGDPVDESLCDVFCENDDDCEALGADYACQAGFCRRQSSADASDGAAAGHEAETCDEEAGGARTCLSSVLLDDLVVDKVEAVDLLFVVDNSGTMAEEQARLRDELPRLITALTTGDLDPSDGIERARDFAPAKDLHLAVVSTDMGFPSAQMSPHPDNKCSGFGDDGLFQHVQFDPWLSCSATYPPFLSYVGPEGDDVDVLLSSAEALANDFACIATLGTGGCGLEMQLEAGLKALWPASPDNMSPAHKAMGISFLGRTTGHGDGAHRDFLRGTQYHSSEPDKLSVLAIILVTDEEDCSAGRQGNLDFLEDPSTAPQAVADQPTGLRCYYDRENRYDVERYIEAFKALRPGYEKLVVFGAITGVPPGFHERDYDLDGDGQVSDPEQREFYHDLLQDPRMQETIVQEGQEIYGEPGGSLMPACSIENLQYDPSDPLSDPFVTMAVPARRIVEVARGFGPNGVVRSICEESFTSAMDAIIEAISKQLGSFCLWRELPRDAEGKLDCNILWEMPKGQECPEGFTSPPPADQPQTTDDGRKICVVNQVPVINTNTAEVSDALGPDHGHGWYYDDFSVYRMTECRYPAGDPIPPRISFTLPDARGGQTAEPPLGVTVKLQGLNQVYSAVGFEDSQLGWSCLSGRCWDSTHDVFCDPRTELCVLGCENDADCPEAWTCDHSPETVHGTVEAPGPGRPICVNKVCESPEAQARNCGNSDVGAFCMPELIPPWVFDKDAVYLETNSGSCDTRICGVFFLEGDLTPDCEDIYYDEPICADLSEDCTQADPRCAAKRLHCTCRCDAPDDPEASTCKCPSGYSCERFFEVGGPGLEGSYCVREGLMDRD